MIRPVPFLLLLQLLNTKATTRMASSWIRLSALHKKEESQVIFRPESLRTIEIGVYSRFAGKLPMTYGCIYMRQTGGLESRFGTAPNNNSSPLSTKTTLVMRIWDCMVMHGHSLARNCLSGTYSLAALLIYTRYSLTLKKNLRDSLQMNVIHFIIIIIYLEKRSNIWNTMSK